MTQQKMTKRQFLRAIGGVAGVAATYHAMNTLGMLGPETAHAAAPDLPYGSGYGKRVVILGAGISGMTAAYELSRAGYHCTILEATNRAGGRNLTARGGDVIREVDSRQWVDFDGEDHLYANLGPARIPHHHRAILDYCKEFGVELEVFTNDNRGALFHNLDHFDGQAVAARRVSTDLRGYIAELLAKAVNRDALDSELTGDDKERVLAMLVEFGDLDPDHLYQGSSRGGHSGEHVHAGLEPADANDPLDFSELLRSDFWEYKLHFGYFLDQNPTLLQPVGGMDAIAKAFEQRVGPLIQYGSIVEEIRKTQGGARIVYQNQRRGTTDALDADFVICTIPAPVLKDIPNDFSPETQAAIESVAFVPAVKIGFQTRRRFWEDDHAIYGGISWTDQDITQIWYPANGYHRDKGVILGAYIWDDRPGQGERFANMTPPERLRTAIAEGEHIHPGYAEEIESGVSRAWLKVPYQKGGWPESYKAPKELREPDGAIYFAGDQVTALPGWQEGAALAAHSVVNAINERVMAG